LATHWPAVGVNVYVVVAVLFIAGDQVPVIAGVLVELVGKAVKVAPEQIGATALKVGVMLGFTVIVSVVVVAH
jgi:transcription antitermination factor NusG